MNQQEYFENQIKNIREQFKNHIVKKEVFGEGKHKIEKLKWFNPLTSNYYIYYIITDRNLIVYGDLGEQIYCFNSDLSYKGFTNELCFNYCIGKARGIDGYSDTLEWNNKYGTTWIMESLKEYDEELEEYLKENDLDDLRYEINQHFGDELYNYFYETLNLEGEVVYDICKSGKNLNYRMICHFVGLQMINEFLEKNEQKT